MCSLASSVEAKVSPQVSQTTDWSAGSAGSSLVALPLALALRLPFAVGLGAGCTVEPAGAGLLLRTLASPSSDQKAQPLHAFSVIAVPAALGLLNSRPSA